MAVTSVRSDTSPLTTAARDAAAPDEEAGPTAWAANLSGSGGRVTGSSRSLRSRSWAFPHAT
ncbi:hypothetical protein [Streptomyces violascens]|uniref:hypothetical protein n=1 Tax=Streptomyces violascens TaxID=67381 RepID=UPI0036941F11